MFDWSLFLNSFELKIFIRQNKPKKYLWFFNVSWNRYAFCWSDYEGDDRMNQQEFIDKYGDNIVGAEDGKVVVNDALVSIVEQV